MYLGALAAWIEDMPGWFANRGEKEPEQPTWALVAHMLRAASMRERSALDGYLLPPCAATYWRSWVASTRRAPVRAGGHGDYKLTAAGGAARAGNGEWTRARSRSRQLT